MDTDELIIMLRLLIANLTGCSNKTIIYDVSPDSAIFVLSKTINFLKEVKRNEKLL